MSDLFNLQTTSDPIDSLPEDRNPPSHDEIQIIDSLFEKNQTTFEKILNSAKDSVLIGALFVLFSLPIVDSTIQRFVTSSSSPYILVATKAMMFIIVYYIIKNLYTVRKS
jgi:hypothetical protein